MNIRTKTYTSQALFSIIFKNLVTPHIVTLTNAFFLRNIRVMNPKPSLCS